MADLEALDRRVDEGIEHRAHARHLVEVARRDQALAQSLHGLGLRADLQLAQPEPRSSRRARRCSDRVRSPFRWRRPSPATASACSRGRSRRDRRSRSSGAIRPGRRRPAAPGPPIGAKVAPAEGADRDAGKKSAPVDARKPNSRHEQAKPLDVPRQTPFLVVAPRAASRHLRPARNSLATTLPFTVTRRPFGRIYGRAQIARKRERCATKKGAQQGALADPIARPGQFSRDAFGASGPPRHRRYLIWSVQKRSSRASDTFMRAKSSAMTPPICSTVVACFS